MNLDDTIPGAARRLRAGLNGDPDQRAATELLIAAVNGVWLAKLGGWAESVCPTEDTRRPGGLWVDGQQLRGDLAAARLDEANTAAVLSAVNTLVEGRYVEPDPAEPPASLRWGHPELVGRLPSGPDPVDLEHHRVSLLGDSRHDDPPAGDDAWHGTSTTPA